MATHNNVYFTGYQSSTWYPAKWQNVSLPYKNWRESLDSSAFFLCCFFLEWSDAVLTVFDKMTNSLLPNYLAEGNLSFCWIPIIWWVASEIHAIVTGHFVEYLSLQCSRAMLLIINSLRWLVFLCWHPAILVNSLDI